MDRVIELIIERRNCASDVAGARAFRVAARSNSRQLTSPDFDLDGVEDSLEEMDVAMVGVDDEFAIGPLGGFVSADQ